MPGIWGKEDSNSKHLNRGAQRKEALKATAKVCSSDSEPELGQGDGGIEGSHGDH